MSEDFYSVLGVKRTASGDEIKQAYRKLASKLHPDKHPGDKAAEARFKKVNQAYQTLGDPKKRALYDEFGEQALSDNFDAERARNYKRWAGAAGGRGGFGGMPPGVEAVDLEDLFGRVGGAGGMGGIGDMLNELFGRRRAAAAGARASRGPEMKGQDIESELQVDLRTAVHGNTMTLTLDGGQGPEQVQVRIPPGATEGSRLRIKGKGAVSPFGGARGDLVVKVKIAPHPHFRLEGLDLHAEVPVTVSEAYKGSKIQIPTPGGPVTMKVPARSQGGQVVRLRGKGLSRGKQSGDLYVHLQVRIPTSDASEVKKAMDVLDRYADRSIRDDLTL